MENQTTQEIKEAITIRSLFNPTDKDLVFYYDSAQYRVEAGKREQFQTQIAVHGAKKLSDQNRLTTDPRERQVLMTAYLDESDPEVVAKSLGIDLGKIRDEASRKKQSDARVVNMEFQMKMQNEKIARLEKLVEKQLSAQSVPKVEETVKKFYKCDKCEAEFDVAIALSVHARSHKE